MSRTPVPQHLIHDPEETRINAERFDSLCDVFAQVVRPYVEKTLKEEAKLAETNFCAEVAVASWAASLYIRKKTESTTLLDDSFLPVNDDHVRILLKKSLASQSIDFDSDFHEIMQKFAVAAIGEDGSVLLPLQMKIDRVVNPDSNSPVRYTMTHSPG